MKPSKMAVLRGFAVRSDQKIRAQGVFRPDATGLSLSVAPEQVSLLE
jgi:hypothetical protein